MNLRTFLLIIQLLLNIVALLISIRIIYTMATYFFKDKIPYTPTQNSIIEKIINTEIFDSKDNILDIGSGTGKVLFQIAQKSKAKRLTGVEKRFELYLYSKLKKFFLTLFHPNLKDKKIKFVHNDIRDHDISAYNKIYLFSLPVFTKKYLMGILEKDLKKNTVLICTMFELPKSEYFQKTKTLKIPDKLLFKKRTIKVYIYKKIKS